MVPQPTPLCLFSYLHQINLCKENSRALHYIRFCNQWDNFEIIFMPNISKITLLSVILFCFISLGCKAQLQTNSLQLIETTPLQNVSGRIDHLNFDSKNNFVFVAALGNNTIEVVDLKSKKIIHSIKNLHEPQGVVFIAENNSIAVANGDNGACDFFNATSFQKISSVPLGDDADNIRYDLATKKIYVGYGTGGIAIIDATSFKFIAQIKFSGHPESFQIDRTAKRLYVNVPDEKQIDIIDLSQNKILAQWKLSEASANFPMALDEANHRLFIGCRHPSKLLVLNSETGNIISSLDIDGDTDDIFYNASAKEIYVSCGSGFVDVFNQIDANHYSSNGKTKTNSGARTSLLIPELHQLIIAAPARAGSSAQLMIFKTK
jgi:DNA-binding beta-propeller fold protein YncE